MAKGKPEKTAPKPLSIDLDAMAAEAEKKPDILPRLKFGEKKDAEVVVILEVLEPTPRPFEFESPFSKQKEPGLALNVRVHDADFDVTPGLYSLPMNADANHGLTAGVLKAWKRNGKSLEGKWLRIATRNYTHKQFGETRSYYVHEVAAGSLATSDAPSNPHKPDETPGS